MEEIYSQPNHFGWVNTVIIWTDEYFFLVFWKWWEWEQHNKEVLQENSLGNLHKEKEELKKFCKSLQILNRKELIN